MNESVQHFGFCMLFTFFFGFGCCHCCFFLFVLMGSWLTMVFCVGLTVVCVPGTVCLLSGLGQLNSCSPLAGCVPDMKNTVPIYFCLF